MSLDPDACYRALGARDARFDGRFFVGVRSTGIYCRPVCPARRPKRQHCTFWPSAAAAQRAGFRPCLRCRPEASPDLAAWRGTSNTVSRALAMIGDGALDEAGVEALALRLGIGGRHLRRLFREHLGAAPVSVAQTRRLLFAKKLVSETRLPMAEIALAAGFGSVRRFNAAIREIYGKAPRELRRARAREDAALRGADVGRSAPIELTLPYAGPFDWPALAGFLAARAIPGIEAVDARRGYRRTIALGGVHGSVEVRPGPRGKRHLAARIRFGEPGGLAAIVARLRALFDLGADVRAIAQQLAEDPLLAARVAARPGLRVPGAWDGFELAVRAILGQQVSVAAATRLAGKLVAAYGEPLSPEAAAATPDASLGFVFPAPERLAGAELARTLGMPGARANAIRALARATADDPTLLLPGASLEDAVARLRALPGIGEWTAQYIAMRALREPDAFPAGDIGLLRALGGPHGRPTAAALAERAEGWRPWRAYAALHLWTADAAGAGPAPARRAGGHARPASQEANSRVGRRAATRSGAESTS